MCRCVSSTGPPQGCSVWAVNCCTAAAAGRIDCRNVRRCIASPPSHCGADFSLRTEFESVHRPQGRSLLQSLSLLHQLEIYISPIPTNLRISCSSTKDPGCYLELEKSCYA